jgi:hypothetical protein
MTLHEATDERFRTPVRRTGDVIRNRIELGVFPIPLHRFPDQTDRAFHRPTTSRGRRHGRTQTLLPCVPATEATWANGGRGGTGTSGGLLHGIC